MLTDWLLTTSAPLLVSSWPSLPAVQNEVSSPSPTPMSLRTWAAPLPLAMLMTPGTSRVTCFALVMPVSSFRWLALAAAVTLVPSTVMSYRAVTSLPFASMPSTEDWAAVSASASYTRIELLPSASNR